ncbi:AAA family ATPase [Pseudomonas sp. NW5]|uniref:AAA family ATPase n=1 Tax=Pseudomonas sp. NW5 TaxID=2934934 RepID=UPI0020223BDC|nr:AAA family ATPase [Pseudomonas sp. NW5]MCL7461213.1 AAA family ATPase [Pseudomonas sp. NW5]
MHQPGISGDSSPRQGAVPDVSQPRSMAETGLSELLLTDLLCKHLYDAGSLDAGKLMQRTGLAGPVLDELIGLMRRDGRLEVLGQAGVRGVGLRYGLTERGRTVAREAMERNSYLGPAPYPIERYRELLKAQTVHHATVTAPRMHEAFTGLVVHEVMLDRLGAALNSGRAMMLYGPAGTGKTFIGSKLIRLFDEAIWVPHAVAINEIVIEIYDPQVHRLIEVDEPEQPNLLLEDGHDRRLLRCKRPVVVTGGELTMDQLEIRHDAITHRSEAPLQLKAGNGIFIIDDLGRQSMPPAKLLNRWIVPMEEKKEYLNLGGGRHSELPFDVILVFSTNINPLQLADEAFLRRIGYKVYFTYLTRDEYAQIWRQEMEKLGLAFDPELLQYVLDELHAAEKVPLLPCHPRDILGMAMDRKRYLGSSGPLVPRDVEWAWRSYFVRVRDFEQGDKS